jgi:hypothetical protein
MATARSALGTGGKHEKAVFGGPLFHGTGTTVLGALSCLDVRPLIKGYFSALRWSRVRSCLRPSFAENRIRWP